METNISMTHFWCNFLVIDGPLHINKIWPNKDKIMKKV